MKTERALRTARTEARPGDDFVEDDERAGAPRPCEETFEESRLRGHQTHIAHDGLDGDGRQPILAPGQHAIDIREIVVTCDGHIAPHAGGNSAARGSARRLRRCSGVVQRGIEVAVIVARKTEHERSLGERSRDAKRAHHRLGPGRDEAQAFQRGNRFSEALGEPDLVLVRRAEHGPSRRDRVEPGHEGRVRVPEQQRPVGQQIVDEASPGVIVRVRPAPVGLDERRTADGRPARTGELAPPASLEPVPETIALMMFASASQSKQPSTNLAISPHHKLRPGERRHSTRYMPIIGGERLDIENGAANLRTPNEK